MTRSARIAYLCHQHPIIIVVIAPYIAQVCQLRNMPIGTPFACQAVHQFDGGSVHRLLSRSQLFPYPGSSDGRLVAAYSEETKKMVSPFIQEE